ncbi:MAG: 4Fe-4S binding protein [Candidatus Marinimicrobia bacterium]|nr:4Fe-4S binding protein [Candidatus Neomarinimicrobiota bacterium]
MTITNTPTFRRRFSTFLILLISLISISVLFAQEGAEGSPPGFFYFWSISRVWMSGIFTIIGLVLLMKFRLKRNTRLIWQAITFFVFSIIAILPWGNFAEGLGLHPSPACILTKPFLWHEIPLGFISIIVSILLLSVIGSKMFCGWVCPLGALQELINRISFGKKRNKKLKIKLPFKVTNTIRILVAIVFLPIAFFSGVSIYDYFNPFEFLHWGFDLYLIFVMLITMVAALFIYRPFCYLICPMGLITWVFEHFAFLKIRFHKDNCTDCKICVRKTECPTVQPIMDMKTIRPDCHACGRCVEVCPEDALTFGR